MKLSLIFLASSLCVMNLSAYESSSYSNPSAYQYQGNYNQSQPSNWPRGQMFGSSSDQNIPTDNDLAKKIQDELHGGMFSKDYKNVKFRVGNRSVTITGWVDSESDIHTIMERVAKIRGLRMIDNQVQVKPLQSTTSSSSY